ncbi:MAG: scpA [Parcubacteria group bacterium]|nr:scpA [Parcubacteria group bacterium]
MESVIKDSALHIRTDSYEGPFELVLDLIEKRKLSVNEITLSQVTDDYITHVRTKASFPMEDAAQFIGVAATLLLIKSKSLIPDLELSEDEETDVDELKRRLAEYERVRDMMRELSKVFGRSVMVSAGERAPEVTFAPSKDLTLANLTNALADTLLTLEKEEKLPEVRVRPLVTIEEMMGRLVERVQKTLTLSFKDFAGDTKEKVEIIVSFLALLELVKQGAVDAAQHDTFADIRITNTSSAVPNYS